MIVRVNNSAYGDEVEHFESVGRLRLKCDCTRAETTFRLSAKRTSPFKSAGASVQSTTGSRGVRISGGNAGYMFRDSVKSTGNQLHSPISPSPPFPCVTVCHHISIAVYPQYVTLMYMVLCPQELHRNSTSLMQIRVSCE